MIHEPGCECGAYACELRAKGVIVSPKATPSRRNSIPPRKNDPPSWNKQFVYEDRPGGTKMPILRPDGSQMRIKEYSERRHTINDQLAKIRAGKT